MTRRALQGLRVGAHGPVWGSAPARTGAREASDPHGARTVARAIGVYMPGTVSRRDLLAQLGVTGAAALAGSAAGVRVARIAHAQDKPKGASPDKPFRIAAASAGSRTASRRTGRRARWPWP